MAKSKPAIGVIEIVSPATVEEPSVSAPDGSRKPICVVSLAVLKVAHATPDGATCVAVCANALAFGFQWDLACRTNAQTCAAASLCP